MTTAQENVLMTHVEGDAPMGQWMREHWIPCVRSAQLVAGGKPEPGIIAWMKAQAEKLKSRTKET